MKKIIVITVLCCVLTTHRILQAQITGSGAANYVPKFTNTTVVGNSVIYQNASSNIGIGTISPTQKLDVNGAVNALNFYSNGKIGLGTTSPYWDIHIYKSSPVSQGLSIENFSSGAYKAIYLTNYGSTGSGDYWTGLSSINSGSLYYNGPFIIRASNDLIFSGSAAAEHMRVTAAGNLGIGTTSPVYKLDVVGTINATQILIGGQPISAGGGNSQWTTSGNTIYYNSGNVLIGQTTQISSSYKLDVKGKVRAEEIIVNTTGTYPDFVFEKNYKLMPLNELEKSIKENGHLPNIPSAKEAAGNGIAVGDMQTKLLQKIEELTLYVIELKKENEETKQMIEKSKK